MKRLPTPCRNDWMQTPSFGPEDEGLLVLPSDLSEDELLEAVVENDGGVELKDEAKKAEETGEMENLEQAEQAADGEQDESNLQQAGKGPIVEECLCQLCSLG